MDKASIIKRALELGFSRCGFARCEPLEEIRGFYSDFVTEKRFAGMQYMERYAPQRLDPDLVMPRSKTVISVAMNYFPPVLIPDEDNYIIAKYAYGRDYHHLMREGLDSLSGFIRTLNPAVRLRAFVDSGPILEKAWAQRCGIGWQGKNTLVINKSDGSFFFIGILLTDQEIEPDEPETEHCGDCDRCTRACPAGALDVPWQLDIPRCISYLTIESRAEVPEDLKNRLGDRIYGCDICQDVCPYNRFARAHDVTTFLPKEELLKMRRKDWISLTETEFVSLFDGTPVKRVGYNRFIQNIRANQTPS